MKITYTHTWESTLDRIPPVDVEIEAHVTDEIVCDPDAQVGEREVDLYVTSGPARITLTDEERAKVLDELDARIAAGLDV